MDTVKELDEEVVPAPVGIAGYIGMGKGIFEAVFGVIGLSMAHNIDNSFGTGMLVFGIVFTIASLLLLRGNRVGYYLTLLLSALGLLVALVYIFGTDGATFFGIVLVVFFNALVLYLLLGRKSAREYFAR